MPQFMNEKSYQPGWAYDQVICPYCMAVQSYEGNMDHEESWIGECDSCKQEFRVINVVVIEYSTTKLED